MRSLREVPIFKLVGGFSNILEQFNFIGFQIILFTGIMLKHLKPYALYLLYNELVVSCNIVCANSRCHIALLREPLPGINRENIKVVMFVSARRKLLELDVGPDGQFGSCSFVSEYLLRKVDVAHENHEPTAIELYSTRSVSMIDFDPTLDEG